MNWFLGFLLVCSIAANVILALVLADIRAVRKLPDNDDLDRELLRIVNGR